MIEVSGLFIAFFWMLAALTGRPAKRPKPCCSLAARFNQLAALALWGCHGQGAESMAVCAAWIHRKEEGDIVHSEAQFFTRKALAGGQTVRIGVKQQRFRTTPSDGSTM